MKRKIVKSLILSTSMIGMLLLGGCGNKTVDTAENKSGTESLIEVQHDLGSTKIEGEVKNVVVLELSFLDSLYQLGVTPTAIADDNNPDMIAEITKDTLTKDKYKSIGARKEPNLEELSMMDVDLIIADTKRHSEIYNDLSKIAPTISLKSSETTYDEYIENFKLIADILNKEEAETKISDFENKLSETKSLVEQKLSGNKIFMLSPKTNDYQAYTSSSFVGTVLEKAGFNNLIQDENSIDANLSLEQVVELNPQVIIYMRADKDDTVYSQWKDTELYKSIDAVKNGQEYTANSNGPWIRYRGFTGAEIIVDEMSEWLLS